MTLQVPLCHDKFTCLNELGMQSLITEPSHFCTHSDNLGPTHLCTKRSPAHSQQEMDLTLHIL